MRAGCSALPLLHSSCRAQASEEVHLSVEAALRALQDEVDAVNMHAGESDNMDGKGAGQNRKVGEAQVVVMKGEYSYIGVDGNEWKVS